MLAAIGLDDQMPIPADEIADVGSDGLLPYELVAMQLTIANMLPEQAFGIGLADRRRLDTAVSKRLTRRASRVDPPIKSGGGLSPRTRGEVRLRRRR